MIHGFQAMVNPDIRTGLRLALRARMGFLIFWALASLVLVTLMAAEFSARQPATVSLDVGLSFIRLFLPLLIVMLAQELFTREFERRYALTTLSYPRSRQRFLLSRFGTLLLVTAFALVLLGTALAVITTVILSGYAQATAPSLGLHYLLTLVFIGVDTLVLAAVATLLGITAVTPSFVLIGTFGFMLIARSYSSIIALLEGQDYLVTNAEHYQGSLGLLNYLVPDLGALDIRATTLYGKMAFFPEDWLSLLLASLFYASALLIVSLWFLQHKRYS